MKVAENKNTKHQEGILDAFLMFFKQKDLMVTDIIPYKRITDEGYLVDREDNYQAYLKVKTTDLVSMNPDDLNRFIHQLTNIIRLYTENLKLLALTYSTETTEQQVYWKKKINQYRRILSNNPKDSFRYEVMLRLALDNYRRNSWVEENLSELTFFFVVYGKTEKEIKNRTMDLTRMAGKQFSLQSVSREKTANIVFRLTNMNTDL